MVGLPILDKYISIYISKNVAQLYKDLTIWIVYISNNELFSTMIFSEQIWLLALTKLQNVCTMKWIQKRKYLKTNTSDLPLQTQLYKKECMVFFSVLLHHNVQPGKLINWHWWQATVTQPKNAQYIYISIHSWMVGLLKHIYWVNGMWIMIYRKIMITWRMRDDVARGK